MGVDVCMQGRKTPSILSCIDFLHIEPHWIARKGSDTIIADIQNVEDK